MPGGQFCVADTGATIRPAVSGDDLNAVKALCWEYRDFLLANSSIDREITQLFYPEDVYQGLMDNLAVEHARPGGVILLAEQNGSAVGCGMTHALTPEMAEIKRVYIAPTARNQGLAGQICEALIEQARRDGYQRVVLDTSTQLPSAQRLYERLGFARCAPYQPIPSEALPHLVFYEMPL